MIDLADFRDFLDSKGKGADWSDDQLERSLVIAHKQIDADQGSDQAPGEDDD